MKTRLLPALSLLGLLTGLTTETQAGPVPGNYRGDIVRNAVAATPKVVALQNVIARASNPEPLETFSTKVFCSRSQGLDLMTVDLSVLPNGKVLVGFRGKIKNRTSGALVNFNISAVGDGVYTSTSFRTTIRNASIGGIRRANITAEAESTGKRLVVQVSVDPILNSDPLGDITCTFAGTRP